MTKLAVGVYYYAWDISAVTAGNYTARALFTNDSANYGGVLDILVVDSIATAAALATVDTNVDSILEDTGTTIPGTITTMQGNVTSILEDTGTTIPASIDALPTAAETTDAVWDELQAGHVTASTFGSYLDAKVSTANLGYGSTDVEFTVTDTDGTVEQGVQVIVYTDIAMTTGNEATGILYTSSSGKVTCYLDTGTYYAKASKEGKTFSNPTTVTVP
jgi:hypothetical protein